jgi:hypothetical protein
LLLNNLRLNQPLINSSFQFHRTPTTHNDAVMYCDESFAALSFIKRKEGRNESQGHNESSKEIID